MLGASWTPLGQLLGALGRLLAPLGRSLGASWTLLGRSWASLGRFGMDLGHIFTPGNPPGLDFGGFGDVSGWVLEALRAMFRCSFSYDLTVVAPCFYLRSNHALSFTCAFGASPPVRRSVHRTWNQCKIDVPKNMSSLIDVCLIF